MTERHAAVLAGGLGTRIESVTKGRIPKAMIAVAGRPFIDHKLDELKRLGVTHAVLLLATHSDLISDHVADGSAWGIKITIALDGDRLLGTGGSIRRSLDMLPSRFWITYGDTLLDADLASAEETVAARPEHGVMTVLRNQDRWETSNVTVKRDLIRDYQKGSHPGTHEYIDYGYLYLPASSFRRAEAEAFDLGSILQALITSHCLQAFTVTEPFHDIGTPEALQETEQWIAAKRGRNT